MAGMGEIMAMPFRLGPNGSVIKVNETSDTAVSQLIAAAILTRIGERLLFPTFGITDPVFNQVSAAEVAAVLTTYGPNVQLQDVSAYFTDATTQQVNVTYSEKAPVNA